MFDNVCEPGYCAETPVSWAFVGTFRGKLQQFDDGAFLSTVRFLSCHFWSPFSTFLSLSFFLSFFPCRGQARTGSKLVTPDPVWFLHGGDQARRAQMGWAARNLYGISETVTKRKNQGKMVRRGRTLLLSCALSVKSAPFKNN